MNTCIEFSLYFVYIFVILFSLLQYVKKIKVLQEQREGGEWMRLQPTERRQQEDSLRQTCAIARFYNIMSNETMSTLVYISNGEGG